jgi:hypothetical protein
MTSNCVIHLEVDGVNVTGPVVLPNTGSWNAYYADGMVKYTQDLQDGNF